MTVLLPDDVENGVLDVQEDVLHAHHVTARGNVDNYLGREK